MKPENRKKRGGEGEFAAFLPRPAWGRGEEKERDELER